MKEYTEEQYYRGTLQRLKTEEDEFWVPGTRCITRGNWNLYIFNNWIGFIMSNYLALANDMEFQRKTDEIVEKDQWLDEWDSLTDVIRAKDEQ